MSEHLDRRIKESFLPYAVDYSGRESEQYPRIYKTGLNDGFYRWNQTCSGQGLLKLDGKEYIIKEGMGFLLDDGPHEYYQHEDSKDNWITRYVRFSGYDIENFFKLSGLKPRTVLYYPNIEKADGLIDKITMLHFFGNALTKDMETSALLYQLLIDIALYADLSERKKKSQEYEKISSVIDYMRQNVYSSPTLADFSSAINVTEQYLCALFKKRLNDTPQHYFRNIKIEISKYIIMNNPDKTINEISQDLNFVSPSHFGKIFKDHTGITPFKFKQQNTLL